MGLNKERGLSALIDDMDLIYAKELGLDQNQASQIQVDLIELNPYQPRKHFDEESIENLSKSIQEYGLIQPIIVIKKEDKFILVAGERRLRASKKLGYTHILAFVSELKEDKLQELALIENIQREDLNPIELANSYRDLIKKYKITQEHLGEIIHKSRAQITNTLRLLNLSTKTQSLIEQKKLSQGHAKVLVGLSKENEEEVVDKILNDKLNVRDTEELASSLKNQTIDELNKLHQARNDLKEIFTKLGFKCSKNKNGLSLNLDKLDKIQELISLIKKSF